MNVRVPWLHRPGAFVVFSLWRLIAHMRRNGISEDVMKLDHGIAWGLRARPIPGTGESQMYVHEDGAVCVTPHVDVPDQLPEEIARLV